MIPLRDNIPHRRLPVITVTLIVINLLVFIYEIYLGNTLDVFINKYGFIPEKIFSETILAEKCLPLFTSMFLHAGIGHLIGNMLFMWIFADNVESGLGHFKFLLFYILSGLFAMFLHFAMNIHSKIPAVGASGAIAGILGAYMVMFPNARVLTLIPFFIFWRIVELPAVIFLGIWFLYQFFLGVVSIGEMGAGIAFWAHIGGFISGIILLSFFRKNNYGY